MNIAGRARTALIWSILAIAVAVPVAAAAASPLLAWRQPVYIMAGFAGIAAMILLLIQPLLIGGYLPGISSRRSRRIHVWVGSALVLAVVMHVVGLWITSPPDVVDALLFVSPTPFSAWGVLAMWALLGAALVVALKERFRLRPRVWKLAHTALVALMVVGSVVHAVLIEGTMEPISKFVLCGLALTATMKVVLDLQISRKRNFLKK